MNIDQLADEIIAKSRNNIAAILKSELEKIKIRDLKELKADTVYYNYDITEAEYDRNKEWMKDKPDSIRIIYAFDYKYKYYSQGSTNYYDRYWYITDRGLTICYSEKSGYNPQSGGNLSNYYDEFLYNHSIMNKIPDSNSEKCYIYNENNSIILDKYKISYIDAWKEIEIMNQSLSHLPITWYNLLTKKYKTRICSDKYIYVYYLDELTKKYKDDDIMTHRTQMIIYLCEMARNAAKIPHINDLALQERLSIDNEIDMRRIRDSNAELDKRRRDLDRELVEFYKTRDEQYKYFQIEREKLDNQHKIVKADLARMANYNNVTDFHYLYKKMKDIISYSRSDIDDPNLRKQLDEIESIIYKKRVD